MSGAVSFAASKDEYGTITAIVMRAVAEGIVPKGHTFDAIMDVTACHANGCPLRLDELLQGALADFAHDVLGIRRYIDRSTGQLTECFLPRYTNMDAIRVAQSAMARAARVPS